MQWRPGVLEVTAIDVGQGDSLLLVTPRGQDPAAGFRRHAGHICIPTSTWAKKWSRRICGRAASAISTRSPVSHPHEDHMGGMRSVIAQFPAARNSGTAWNRRRRICLRWRRRRSDYGVSLRRHAARRQFRFRRGTGSGAQSSAGLAGTRSGGRTTSPWCCTFSMAKPRCCWWATRTSASRNIWRTKRRSADLLKIGHHGSATSSTPEFLAAVKPRYAVVSVGLYNSFQHPRPEVMQRYAGAGIPPIAPIWRERCRFLLDGSTVTAQPGSSVTASSASVVGFWL